MSKFEKNLKGLINTLSSKKNISLDSFDAKSDKVLIYGSYGYTGELIVKHIKENNLQPLFVIAGRNAKKLKTQAEEMEFDRSTQVKQFDVSLGINNDEKIDSILKENNIKVVLNCAGPFSQTAYPIIDACVRNGVSYLDITGEFKIFEHVNENRVLNFEAQKNNVVLIPGVGYDVVPSDCLAKSTVEEFNKRHPSENAHHVEIAMTFGDQKGAISQGTKKTMAREMLTSDGLKTSARRNGKIVHIPLGSEPKEFEFDNGKKYNCGLTPWGDISTAYFSTHVRNISVYFAKMTVPKAAAIVLSYSLVQLFFGLLFKVPGLVTIAMKIIEMFSERGPSDKSRKEGNHHMTCIVSNKKGDKKVTGYLKCCEGYTLTSQSALFSSLKVLAKDYKENGGQTPSLAFGSKYAENFDDTEITMKE